MRCMSCGAEMHVLRVDNDDASILAGYERQTWQCSACHDVDTRTVLRDAGASPPVEPVPHHPAPPTSTSPLPEDEPDDGEELLRRAIEMVRGPVRRAQPAKGPIKPAPAVSAASVIAAAEAELDEGEAMLQRAIEMVRGPTRGGRPQRANGGIAAAADPVKAIPAKRSPPSRVVQICHDPSFDAAYAAQDTTSGLVVIRHQDSARLRAMCDRLGWLVVESEAPGTGV
jgi:hypothetical protein